MSLLIKGRPELAAKKDKYRGACAALAKEKMINQKR